jgi:adenylate cyclase class 1
MFCLDDCGALFHQHYENISEPVFLAQQQRLFTTLTSRRMLASAAHAGEMLAGGTRFYRLGLNPEGWTARPVEPPSEPQTQQLGLQLVTSRDGLAGDNFSLMVEEREFDALRLGPELYAQVAAFVLARRRPGQDYPIRITGVLPAGLEEGAGWTVNEMLRTKRRIERRLTAAMRQLAKQHKRRPA